MSAEKLIYWFEEAGKEHNDILGKKCANLGETTRLGIPVPPGFAISINLYRQFLEESGAGKEMKRCLAKIGDLQGRAIPVYKEAGKALQTILLTKEMPPSLKNEIVSFYEQLCEKVGLADLAVSVRSAGTESRPGMFNTYLNVKGVENVLQKVKEVWASAYTPRGIAFRAKKGIPALKDELGVGIVKMVNAKSAGIGFTVDPVTGDDSQIIIEANWGLGEGVVSGIESVDRFIVTKENHEIKERNIGKKLKCVIMQDDGAGWEETPLNRQSVPCLSDDEIAQVVKLSLKLEKLMGKPQDIEWAFDSDFSFPDNLFLLQTRPAKVHVSRLGSSTDQLADKLIGSLKGMDFSKAKDKIKNMEFRF
jgi:pyruvate,water dikinase